MATNLNSENKLGEETPKTISFGNTLNDSAPKANTYNESDTPTLTFGTTRFFSTMNSGLGSEYLNRLLEQIKAVYASEQNTHGYKINVLALDKEVKSNLAYSSIIVSLLKNNKAIYFIILLEGTGKKPLDAKTTMNELANMGKMQYNGRISDVSVASDAIDIELDKEIQKQLLSVYPSNVKLCFADGMVIPYYNNELDPAIIRPIASTAFNACIIEGGKLNNEFKDLNITASINNNPGAELKIDTNMLPTVSRDATGKPIRCDWTIELNSVDKRNQNSSLNLQNNRNLISRTSGFVDAIQVEERHNPITGMLNPVPVLRLRPHVILTSIETDLPTTGYTLLSVVTSLVMTRPNMWLAAVTPKSNDPYHDISKLNTITNLENNQNGYGEDLNLRDGSLKPQEMFDLIRQMYTMDTMFSIDVEDYGAQTSHTSILSTAAAPATATVDAEYKINAAREIINAANWLTNGAFPSDFNPNDIFINNGIMVPTGRWKDKNGESRDIRDVDLSFIATNGQSVDIDLLNKWALSNVPHSISGIDPYVSKVEIISKVLPNAEITGKAIRCTFSSVFMNTLSRACAQAGFETRYDPEVTYSEQSHIAVLGDYLLNAGVSQDAANFARTFNNGSSYQTPWSFGGRHHRQY